MALSPQSSVLSPSIDVRLRRLLFCLLLGVYLLVYIPKPNSADGDALLAVAASTVRTGSPDINAIAYADWLLPLPASRMGAFGVDGALYAKKGPTPSLLLLPFVAVSDALPWLSTRAAAMLFNPLVTAATAVALYALVRRLGYRPRVAFALGLLYGLATFAVVYVKTLFGEPLAALLLLLAVSSAHRARDGFHARALLACGASLGLLVGVNTVYAVFAPLVMGYLFLPLSARQARRAVILLAPLLVALACLALYNWARFGSPLDSGYHFAEGEGFNRPLLTGLYGLFLSPYRGLFWYNPVLLLAVPGWLLFRRAAPRLAWLCLALALGQALAFAAWWSWHGGIVWGPRFLLPAAPLVVLFLAPLVDAAFSALPPTRAALIRLSLVALVVLSFGIQMLGALYSYYPYINGYLNALYWTGEFDSAVTALRDDVLYTPALSPIVGHLALAVAGWELEPAWLARGIDVVHLLAALALLAAGLAALKLSTRYATALITIVALVSLNVVVARQQNSPDIAQARALSETLQPPGTVVAATTLYETSLLDLKRSRMVVMNAPTAPDDTWANALWDYAWRQGGSLWYVTWFGVGDPQNWQERDLWQTTAFVAERAAPGHRALRFDLSPAPSPDVPVGASFGALRLDAYGATLAPDGVRLSIQWSADSPLDAGYTWFIHLVDSGGAIVAQQDRAPQGGYAPTRLWTPGAPVLDRLFFPLPPDTNADGWTLRVGWIDPATGERLPARAADGSLIADGFILLPLQDS